MNDMVRLRADYHIMM